MPVRCRERTPTSLDQPLLCCCSITAQAGMPTTSLNVSRLVGNLHKQSARGTNHERAARFIPPWTMGIYPAGLALSLLRDQRDNARSCAVCPRATIMPPVAPDNETPGRGG